MPSTLMWPHNHPPYSPRSDHLPRPPDTTRHPAVTTTRHHPASTTKPQVKPPVTPPHPPGGSTLHRHPPRRGGRGRTFGPRPQPTTHDPTEAIDT